MPYLDMNKSFQVGVPIRNGEEFVTSEALPDDKDPHMLSANGSPWMNTKLGQIGSSFESFLDEEGIKKEVHKVARERVQRWVEGAGVSSIEKGKAQRGSRQIGSVSGSA